jgi:hypothetical protein
MPILQPTIFNTFIFVASNEVECVDKKMWFVEMLLANKPRRKRMDKLVV